MAYRGASEEEFGHGYGTGGYSDGGSIAAQINRGTDNIRDDLRAGGEALRDTNRNYYQNIGNALENGMNSYERGTEMAARKESRERESKRFDTEQNRAKTEEEMSRQNLEKGQMEIGNARRKQVFDEAADPETGKTHEEMTWGLPFQEANTRERLAEEQIAGGRADRNLRTQEFGLTKQQDERAVAANKAAKENENIGADISMKLGNVPKENFDQEASRLALMYPPEKAAVVKKAIRDTKAERSSDAIVDRSTDEGQIKSSLYKSSFKARSDADELKGKLATFISNKDKGGINTPFGDLPSPVGFNNDAAKNSLAEIANYIRADGTTAANELADKILSPVRTNNSIISEVNAYINAKEQQTKSYATHAAALFPAGQNDPYLNSMMHLTSGIKTDDIPRPGAGHGGNTNTPDYNRVSSWLTGGDQPDQQGQITNARLNQLASTANFKMPAQLPQQPQGAPQGQTVSTGVGQVAPQQPMPQQGAPQMTPPPQVSPLRAKYGKQH